jgi:hypothetical protein
VTLDGDGCAVTPLFVSITPSITLTDHNGQSTGEAPPSAVLRSTELMHGKAAAVFPEAP